MNDEPLIEPEPVGESELERRLRERDRRVPWVRLVVLVLALVALLVFYNKISEGMAGCYGQYVEPQAATKKGAPTVAPAGEINLEIEPARPLERAE